MIHSSDRRPRVGPTFFLGLRFAVPASIFLWVLIILAVRGLYHLMAAS